MIYRWKGNARPYKDTDAQVVGEHLERLRQHKGGRLKSEQIVEDARFKGSPLHRCFEWDDAKAAHSLRVEVAGDILRRLVVVPKAGDVEALQRPAFVLVKKEGCYAVGEYTSMKVARTNVTLRAEIVERAVRELEQWRQRYIAYGELNDFIIAIDLVFNARMPKPMETKVEASFFACPKCGGRSDDPAGHSACRSKKMAVVA